MSHMSKRTVNVHIRLTKEEAEALDKLAKYLHLRGKIARATRSEAMRLCLRYTLFEILKAIERERYSY